MAQPWEILTAPERQAVGAYMRQIAQDREKGKEYFRRSRARYRKYCEYLAEQKRMPKSWVDELFTYGADGRSYRAIVRETVDEFEQLRIE